MSALTEIVDSTSETGLLNLIMRDLYNEGTFLVVQRNDDLSSNFSLLADFLGQLGVRVVGYKFKFEDKFIFLKCESETQAREHVVEFQKANNKNEFNMSLSIYIDGRPRAHTFLHSS